DKVELDGKIVKEEKEAVKRIKGEAFKEKDDPREFIFPIILEGQVYENAEDMKKVDRGITMINQTQAEAIGILTNVLCQEGVTTLIAKFLILNMLIDRDSPILVGRRFLRTIDSIVNTQERLFSTFDGFCHQTFCAARSDVMRNTESDSDDEKDYQIKRNKLGVLIYGPKPAPYLNCNDTDERSLWEHTMMRPDHQDPNAQDNMRPWKMYCFHKFTMSSCYEKDVTEMQSLGCDGEIDDMLRIRLREAGSDEKIFTSKIIKFRLGGCVHSLTLLEFARRLGLYQTVELKKEGFNVYFERGLRSDEHFNAQDYWLSISREKNLGLSRSHTSTIRNLILRVIHKMITYGLCQRTTGYDKVQKNDLWLLSMFNARHQNGYANFISKIARKCKVLTEDVVRSLSASIYCRDLDTITLRDLIDSEGKLIPKDPQPGVPRVGIPRPPRASMQDLYDRIGRMDIRQEAIERMEYRQSYHWDRYHGVFEHMAGVYSVPLQGAYNPPGYAQPQYDQYYQQYPPSPLQYQ
ncbi:hypothetical protein Tco_1466721, partial [Tanacetum coccineum]